MTEPTQAPMNIREALVAMTILGPRSHTLIGPGTGTERLEALMKNFRDDSPRDALRLLSLMQHRDLDDVVRDLSEEKADGATLIMRLAEGIKINVLPILIDAAYLFGYSEQRWNYGK
jgi:hypothetical protein